MHTEDVNAKCYNDRTPLHVASREGHVDAVRVLLDHGAHLNSQGHINWMPLHFASNGGHPKVVELLLEHEATLNAQSIYGSSPVYLASQSGHLEVVRVLLSRGADVHILGHNETSFEVATGGGYHNMPHEPIRSYSTVQRMYSPFRGVPL